MSPGRRFVTDDTADTVADQPDADRSDADRSGVDGSDTDGSDTGDLLLRRAHTEHGDELYRFCLRALDDRGSAQDCVQEVLLRAWRNAGTYDSGLASLRTWLFAIARHVVIDHRRRAAVRPRLADAEIETEDRGRPGHRPDELEHEVLNSRVVEVALRDLSPEHRTAITQTYLQGRSPTEAAEELGVAPGTVRSRLYYGLRALRGVMVEMGVEL